MRVARSLIAPVTGVIALLVVWEAAVRIFDIRRFVLLAPSAIVTELFDQPGAYWSNTLVTARHMLIGLTVSLMIALVVGSAMAASRFVEEAAQPVLVVILVTPWVAYMTSIVIWLDFGERPILFLVAFTTFPVFAFGVVGGMRSADPAARELLASVDASRWEVLWRLRLPSALPALFTTGRFAIALALAAAYFAEGSALEPRGLGVIGRRATTDQTGGAEVLWTTIFCTAALGIVGLAIVSIGERLLLRWHASQRT
ncbi:ABC transporter permease [Ilumatobacter nonamiensis]|uniref:ABC transporter permease n=1 Tax=Ilumatobacter nonamiensis TaxID=467093 RepID=UPI000348A9DB|nr:ABC transporter permease subunit [Ilumatobacter nonamiensis]